MFMKYSIVTRIYTEILINQAVDNFTSSRFRESRKLDAIVISPLTKPEINKIITEYHTNDEIYQYQEKESNEQLKIYFRTYGKDT